MRATDPIPEISIILPTRNRWGRLSRTLAGALRQEGVDFEVVVVDDASTDVTPLRLARLNDPRVRVIRHAERQGVSRSRNEAIAAARGAWLAFLDDDDLWAPDKLAKQVQAASATRATFAYSAALVVNEVLNVLQVAAAPDPVTLRRELLVRNAIPGGCSNLIALASAVRAVGCFDPKLSVLADWDLWIRLAMAGTGAACPEALVAYVRHPESMVSAGRNDVIAEVDHLVEKHRLAAESLGVEPDLRGLYRYFARAHRRAGRPLPASRMYRRVAVSDRSAGDVVRAVAVLFGERAERLKRMVRPNGKDAPQAENLTPGWLDEYRLGGVEIDLGPAVAAGP
jgi:glycosyltransferase involved in cell wall biosynthesis